MQGGGEKRQQGTTSGGAREVMERVVGRIDEVVDANSTAFGSISSPDARAPMERQRAAGRCSVPLRYRPPAPRRCDVSKKQSTNREVEEVSLRNPMADEPINDSSTHIYTSSVRYGGRQYNTNPAPVDPPREPTVDELFSGDINQDAAYRGDWWRGGLYY